jgi:phosphosulfolactate phosphohydrolase-like enzyme
VTIVRIREAFEPAGPVPVDVRIFFDVFRASTTLVALLARGAGRIVSTNDEAAVRRYHADGYLLVSEVFAGGYDNSPTQMLAAPVAGAAIVHKSTNLTTAMFGVGLAERTLVGSFVNASLLVAYVRGLGARCVELVPAGHFAKQKPALEDTVCAELIAAGLAGTLPLTSPRRGEVDAKVADLRQRKTEMPPHYWADLELALSTDALPYLAEVRALAPGLVEIRGLSPESPS